MPTSERLGGQEISENSELGEEVQPQLLPVDFTRPIARLT